MKGRKPLPAKVKELTGNPGKRKLVKVPEPKAFRLRRPSWMHGSAADMWDRVLRAWRGAKVLTSADQGALEAYCAAYGRFVEAQADLDENGLTIKGGTIKNPAATVLNEAVVHMRSLGAEMGLTPSSRVRLAAAPSDTADEFEAFQAADAS